MVRKPTLYDLGKATKLLSENEETQDKILLEWLRLSKNDNFYSLVNVERKKVNGILTCAHDFTNDQVICTLGKLFGTPEVKVALFKKLIKDLDPHKLFVITKDPKEFEELGFTTTTHTMVLERK